MSTDPFRSPPEELAALTKELAELRSALREIGQRLSQIERHVKRAFGVSADGPSNTSPQRQGDRQPHGERQGSPGASRRPDGPRVAWSPPTTSAEEALALFRRLVDTSGREGRGAAEEQLESLDLGDLRLLAQELGLPGGNKRSKRALTISILGRVNESLMLSKNTNVTLPRSAHDQGRDAHPGRDPSDGAGPEGDSPRGDK